MSPIEDTLRRLGPAAERLSVLPRPGHRLVPAQRLARSENELSAVLKAFGRELGTDEPGVAASLFGQAWAVSVTRGAIACLVGERRVPDVAATNSQLLLDESSRPVGLLLDTPRFAAVAGDPAAGHPAAVVLPDVEALFAWTRHQVFERHLAEVVVGLKGIAPVGRRLLWGNVAAAVAGGFAALSLGADHRALLADASAFLDAPGAPTAGLATLFPVAGVGSPRLFVERDTCCLLYRLPEAPDKCLSCRMIGDEERRRRIILRLVARS